MEAVLIVLLAALCVLVPMWLGQAQGVIRWLSPMHLLAYFAFFGFLVKASAYAARPDWAFYRQFVDTPAADLIGVLYLGLFVLLMCLGYRLACAPVDRVGSVAAARLVTAGTRQRGLLFTLAFGVAVATITVILRARGMGLFDAGLLAGLNNAKQINVDHRGVGSTLAGIKTLFIVPKFAFVLLLAHAVVRRSRVSVIQTTLLGGLLIVIALLSGDRFELVEMLVFAGATCLIVGARLSWRSAALLACCVIILGGASAYMTDLRLGLAEQAGLSALLGQIVGSTYFLDFNTAVMVTDRVVQTDLLWGQSYTWWSFGWVPRAIWIDKPAIDLGVFFKRDIMGVTTGGAFNVTGPGEAFINFAWGGLVVAVLLGWFFRKGEVVCLAPTNSTRYATFLLYPLLFYPFIQACLQSSFSAFIVGAAAQAVLIALMIPVFVTRYSAPSRSAIVRRPHYAA